MNIRNKMLAALMLLSGLMAAGSSFAATGGESGGGGGNAVVCRSEDGKIESVELLDLYEGRTTEGFEYPKKSDTEIKVSLQRAVDRLGQAVEPKNAYQRSGNYPFWIFDGGMGMLPVMGYLNNFESIFRILPDDTGLPPLDDSHEIVVPKKCKIERLALYKGTKILVDGSLWRKMDNFNKAALVLHEAIYKYDRQMMAAKNSRNARKIVARFMSDDKIENIFDGLPESEPVKCNAHYLRKDLGWGGSVAPADTVEFYLFWKDGKIQVNFSYFFGVAIFSKTAVEVEKPVMNRPNGDGKQLASWVDGLPTVTLHYGNFTDRGIDLKVEPHFVLAIGKTESSESKWIDFSGSYAADKDHWIVSCSWPFKYKE